MATSSKRSSCETKTKHSVIFTGLFLAPLTVLDTVDVPANIWTKKWTDEA